MVQQMEGYKTAKKTYRPKIFIFKNNVSKIKSLLTESNDALSKLSQISETTLTYHGIYC